LIGLTETDSVYCAIRTDPLNTINVNLVLKAV